MNLKKISTKLNIPNPHLYSQENKNTKFTSTFHSLRIGGNAPEDKRNAWLHIPCWMQDPALEVSSPPKTLIC